MYTYIHTYIYMHSYELFYLVEDYDHMLQFIFFFFLLNYIAIHLEATFRAISSFDYIL